MHIGGIYVILEDIGDIINSIECNIETPRKISSEPKTLKEIRDNIKKHTPKELAKILATQDDTPTFITTKLTDQNVQQKPIQQLMHKYQQAGLNKKKVTM